MVRHKNLQPSGDPPPQRELRSRSRPSAQAPNMAGSKRSRPSEHSPPQRQVRPRSFTQAQNLPTPDDALSVADSAAPSISLPAEKKVPAGPANPGIVRNRDGGSLSRLPPDCDVAEEFNRLRNDGGLTDAEAFMKFMRTYDISMNRLHQTFGNVYPIPLHRYFITNIIDDLQSKSCPYRSVTSNIAT
jgi:hypothetical protein